MSFTDKLWSAKIKCPECGSRLIPLVRVWRSRYTDSDTVGATCVRRGHDFKREELEGS